jgi:hypothetical protein
MKLYRETVIIQDMVAVFFVRILFQKKLRVFLLRICYIFLTLTNHCARIKKGINIYRGEIHWIRMNSV